MIRNGLLAKSKDITVQHLMKVTLCNFMPGS